MNDAEPQILVEGGPFYRRTRLGMAGLLGAGLGVAASVVILFSANHSLVHKVCRGDKTLAKIEHRMTERQRRQTEALLKKGNTFGIPKKEIPILVAINNRITDQFLAELDELAKINCN